MKTGFQTLLTVLLVAGGLLAYHMLVAQPAHAPDPVDDEETFDDGAAFTDFSTAPVSGTNLDPTPGMAGGGKDKLARANAARLAKIERTLRALQALQLAASAPSGPRPDPLAPLSPKDLVDPDKPDFDVETMDTLTAYVDEINRRRQRAAEVQRIEQTLTGLGLELPDATSKAVADVSLRMQARAIEELRRDDLLPAERKRLIDELRSEYAAALARVVPPEDVKEILGSRVARRMGLTPPRKGDPRNRND